MAALWYIFPGALSMQERGYAARYPIRRLRIQGAVWRSATGRMDTSLRLGKVLEPFVLLSPTSSSFRGVNSDVSFNEARQGVFVRHLILGMSNTARFDSQIRAVCHRGSATPLSFTCGGLGIIRYPDMRIPSFGTTGVSSSPFTVLGAISEYMIMAGFTSYRVPIKRSVTGNNRRPGNSDISRHVVVRSSFTFSKWKPAHAA